MGNYQSTVKQCGMTLVAGILAVFLISGCIVRKAENTAPKDSQLQKTPATQPMDSVPRAIENITVNPGPDQLEVWITGTQALEYTSIKQSFPFAVSVYLQDTILSSDFVLPPLSDSRANSIKATYADKDQTTVKVEILLNQDLPYLVRQEENRLGIILQGQANAEVASSDDQASLPAVSKAAGTSQNFAADDKLVIPDTPANLTHIAFDTREIGDSDIQIQTSHPVRYETRQVSENELYLILYNTKIPVHHQRPLLTRYFNSAVERVDPRPDPAKSTDTRIDIKLRELVPFRVVQTGAGIQMSFEPSSVQPPEFTKARNVLDSGEQKIVVSQASVAGFSASKAPSQSGRNGENSQSNSVSVQRRGPYTGEKIKLDFYDTDIKNVFRILKSVSGLNFAVDRDVQGKVTLSLEEPVPWDQVLDLVLKMNGLGKKMEENVVRIATAETLQNEEKMIQDAIATRKKSMEQERALEPLVTEYIPINYSDAKADIEPHLTQILSLDRGKISVDQRTNMIIITDTQKKIDQANDLIYRLDKVTPQIMIEAKVVEVTKEFSRTLGMSWNLSNAPSITSGFVDDYNVAVNAGSTIGLTGDFSFFRLFGSSVNALNAKLAASEEIGDVRIVSSPRIMTLDNKKAMIKQGQEYAYLERDDAGGSSVKFKDIDLLLEVTPHVTPDNRISMTVRLTKNDVASLTSTGVPILNTNEAETELLVNNQDTIVIGGVVKSTIRKDDDGLPFLTGIPVFGLLFSQQTKEDNRNELLIFLTPSIVQLEQKRRGTN